MIIGRIERRQNISFGCFLKRRYAIIEIANRPNEVKARIFLSTTPIQSIVAKIISPAIFTNQINNFASILGFIFGYLASVINILQI